jgi:hypothetical protein
LHGKEPRNGKRSKKEALTIDVQKKFLEFLEAVVCYSYENQYRFVLQTELRTIPLTDEVIRTHYGR